MQVKGLLIILLACFAFSAIAADDRYPFKNSVDEQRFQSQIYQIRCLVCQGQSIGDSDSYFAQNMRDWLYNAINDGYSDYEIRQQLIDRFGEQVFYVPALRLNTALLWSLPALFLIFGLIIFWQRGRRCYT